MTDLHTLGEPLILLSLNLGWTTSRTGRALQCERLQRAMDELGDCQAVLALQETRPGDIRRFEAAGWTVLADTPRPRGRLGVAVLGRGVRTVGDVLRCE